jgi:hypothetical protein
MLFRKGLKPKRSKPVGDYRIQPEIIEHANSWLTLDTQLGKLAHFVEFIDFFCKPGPLAGHTFQWFSLSAAN